MPTVFAAPNSSRGTNLTPKFRNNPGCAFVDFVRSSFRRTSIELLGTSIKLSPSAAAPFTLKFSFPVALFSPNFTSSNA